MDKEYLIHCPTQKEFDEVVKKAVAMGHKEPRNIWGVYKEKTVLFLHDDGYWSYGRTDTPFYKEKGVKITTAKQFLTRKEVKEKPFKFILIYDKKCGDPKEYFHTLAEGQKRMRELAKDEDVIVPSMVLIEMANSWKASLSVVISKVKN